MDDIIYWVQESEKINKIYQEYTAKLEKAYSDGGQSLHAAGLDHPIYLISSSFQME